MDASSGQDQNDRDHQWRQIRLVILSDTHGEHELLPQPLPEGDILIHCGDFCNRGKDIQRFVKWFAAQSSCPHKIVIQGNHDRDRSNSNEINLKSEFATTNVQVLLDETVTCCGLHIHGASWESCEAHDFSRVPLSDIDLLLAHINPHVPELDQHGWRGSKALAKTVLNGRIPLCCSGHVHWARGVAAFQRRSGRCSVFVNASSLKPADMGRELSAPVVIDYDPIERKVLTVDCLEHRAEMK